MKMNDIINNINANVHNASFHAVPLTVFAMSIVIILVKVDIDERIPSGILTVFPITICTANASPKALAIPRTTPVSIPDFAPGTITLEIVCHLVAQGHMMPQCDP